MTSRASASRLLARHFGLPARDLPTQDKIPVIQRLMPDDAEGLALDVGIGTGYTTARLLGHRPTVCVDLHAPNLQYYAGRVRAIPGMRPPQCVVAPATALPFKTGAFRLILCSEVLEHLEDDDAAVGELARTLSNEGRMVLTVPYTGMGFTGFLELCGLKTVHDFPGPERHVRPGYDEHTMGALLAKHGLVIEQRRYYLRFLTKLLTDAVSVAHLLYQRIVHRRRAWSWSEAAQAEQSMAFRCYAVLFPVVWALSRLDVLLSGCRGFGLIVLVRKQPRESDTA